MKHFEITLISRKFRIVRNIIATSSVRATGIALDTIPPGVNPAQLMLKCKLKGLA